MNTKYIINIIILVLLSFNAFAQDKGKITPYLSGTVQAGNKRNFSQVQAFIPIIQNENSLFFSDIRFMKNLPNWKNDDKLNNKISEIYEGNLGFGYRFIVAEEALAGIAGFFDYRHTDISDQALKQISANLHYLTPTWQFQMNGYLPIGNKERIQNIKEDSKFTGKSKIRGRNVFFIMDNNNITEKALIGGDLRISYSIPNYENLRLGTLLYGFSSDNTSVLIGGGLTFDCAINDIISFEGQYTYDKTNEHAVAGGIRLTLPFDRNLSKNYNRTEKLFVTRVQRDIDIVTNRKIVTTTVEELQPNIVDTKKSELFNEVKHIIDGSSIDITSSKKAYMIVDDNIPDGETFSFSDIKIYNFELVSKSEIARTPLVAKKDGKLVPEDNKKKDDKLVPNDIKRAGTIPVVKKNGKYYILLCKEKGQKFFDWPSGQYDKTKDNTFKNTAIRETFEESGIEVTEADIDQAISKKTYIFDDSVKTFAAIIKLDNLDIDQMTTNAIQRNQNPNLPSDMKEKDGYCLVPAEEIKKLTQNNAGKEFNRFKNPANVKTIDNDQIRIQSNYANSLIKCAKQLEDSIKSMK